MKDELARTLKDGFTAEEIAAAKKSLVAGARWWAGRRTGAGRTADGSRRVTTARMQFDADLDAKVDLADAAADQSDAFRRQVDLRRISVVKAGDFKKANVYQQ